MDAFNPSDFESEMHGIHVTQGRTPTKGVLFSLVAAYAHDFAYSFEYLQHYVERLNARGSGYVENVDRAVSCPSRMEFLHALEFRLAEIDRCMTNPLARWNWPDEWDAKWGTNVASALNADNCSIVDKRVHHDIRPEKLAVHRGGTAQAIAVQKAMLGHHHPITLNWYTRELLSRIVDVFVKDGRFSGFPEMIQIVWSYDLSESLRRTGSNDHCGRYGIDGILGDYYRPGGGRDALVRVHRRAIDLCAEELKLDGSHLVNVVIVHELAHWLVHRFPHRGITAERELIDWYEASDADVHEAWAQLLTHFVGRRDEGFQTTFNKLLPHQPAEYHLWKRVHDICGDDTDRLLASLITIRQARRPVVFDEWLKAI